MTDDQLAEVVLALEVYWPDSDLSEAAWMGYKQELGRMDYEMVSSALKLFVTEGRDRVPQVGQIMRRVVELEMDIPSWGEVARILMTALRQSPEVVTWAGVDGPEPRRINARRDYIEAQHPLIQGYVSLIGWSYLSEWRTDDRVGEAQMRNKWEAYVDDQLQSRLMRDIGAAGLPRIERAHREYPPESPAESPSPPELEPPPELET